MSNGKAMTVGEMASLFLDPATPVRIDAFDGSHFGPADADLKVKIATPNCMYQLLAHPNEIGIVRSYILGDFDVDGIDYADPYPAMRKLVSLSKYVRPLTPTSIDASCGRICSYFVDLLDAGRTSCPSISPIIVIKCILPCFLLFSSTTCPKS